jgi:hypothetical protein
MAHALTWRARAGPCRAILKAAAPFAIHLTPRRSGMRAAASTAGPPATATMAIPAAITAAPSAAKTTPPIRSPRPSLSSPRSAHPARSCAARRSTGSAISCPDKTASRTCQRCTAGSWYFSMSQLSTASAGWPSPPADTCLRVPRRQGNQPGGSRHADPDDHDDGNCPRHDNRPPHRRAGKPRCLPSAGGSSASSDGLSG